MDLRTTPSDFESAHKATKQPQRVVVAVVQKPDGGYNMITLEWFMRTSITPPMFAISVGHARFSYECLQQNRVFNLVLPSTDQAELARICGSRSGRDADKFALSGVRTFKGRLAGLPVIQGAAAAHECEIVTQVRSGDHTIYVGEVKHTWRTEGTNPLTLKEFANG